MEGWAIPVCTLIRTKVRQHRESSQKDTLAVDEWAIHMCAQTQTQQADYRWKNTLDAEGTKMVAHIIQEIREFNSFRKNKTEFDSLVQESTLRDELYKK